jgi:KaiC/GvpD/RAD55 family RecA-like ATPase
MPDNDLQSLKQHPKVLDLYRTRLSLKQDGRRWRGPCIWHSDKNPSLDVYQHEGTWIHHCLACNASGSIVDAVMKADGVDFKQAVHIVREFCSAWAGDRARVETVFKPVSQEKQVAKTYPEESYKAYEQALQNSPEAKAFLASRGITMETAKRLRIGFRQDVGKLVGESGAAYSDRGWLSFPTFNPNSVTSIKYRSVAGKLFTKQPGMATCLFNTQTIDFLEPVFLVEGELDACVLEQAGFRAVSLSNANHYPSPEEKDHLLSAEYVVLAGDNDDAGKKAMDKIWRDMNSTGRVFYLKWPGTCKDANEYFQKDCKEDLSVFRTKINDLVLDARSHPIPNVVSLPETMQKSDWSSLADHPDRLVMPWKSIDNMVNLLPGSVLNLTATQTGTGKTAWLMNVLIHAARNGKVVLNYSAELSPEEYSNIVAAHLLRKNRTEIATQDLKEASKLISGVKFYIGRDPDAHNSDQVLDLIDKAIPILGCDVVAIDHIHHICQGKQNDVKDQNEAIVRIKNIATRHGVCMIVVSQPRKADQNSKGKEIHITDIKGGGGIADASDAVIALHRDFIKSIDPENPPAEPYDSLTKVRLLKGRSQGKGKAYTEIMFLGSLATFTEVAKLDEPNGSFENMWNVPSPQTAR